MGGGGAEGLCDGSMAAPTYAGRDQRMGLLRCLLPSLAASFLPIPNPALGPPLARTSCSPLALYPGDQGNWCQCHTMKSSEKGEKGHNCSKKVGIEFRMS